MRATLLPILERFESNLLSPFFKALKILHLFYILLAYCLKMTAYFLHVKPPNAIVDSNVYFTALIYRIIVIQL